MDKSDGLLAKLTDGFSVSRHGFVKAATLNTQERNPCQPHNAIN